MPDALRRRQEYAGHLIAFEGCDGCGKSTQLSLLKSWLEEQGWPVFVTGWNSSEIIKPHTKRAKKSQAFTPTTFSLLHACDFAHRYENDIWPRLQAGCMVLADRYVYTAFARDPVRGCDPDWVRNLYHFAVRPDLILYFRAPVEVTLPRILKEREPKLYEAGGDLGLAADMRESFRLFQGLVQERYDQMAGPEGFIELDASLSMADLQVRIQQEVGRRMESPEAEGRSRVVASSPDPIRRVTGDEAGGRGAAP